MGTESGPGKLSGDGLHESCGLDDPRREDQAADDLVHHDRHASCVLESEAEEAMQVHHLEIVTPDVDATCAAMEKLHGVNFSAPEAGLGNARTATQVGGGLIGVRAPMHEAEEPLVRPYVLLDDIAAAAEAAQAAGGEMALPPTEFPGHGKCAIYILDGVQHGPWQV